MREAGLVDSREIARDGITVRASSHRHRHFEVSIGRRQRWFVKLFEDPGSFSREYEALQWLGTSGGLPAFVGVPHAVHVDRRAALIAYRHAQTTTTLHEALLRGLRCTSRACWGLGAAIAALAPPRPVDIRNLARGMHAGAGVSLNPALFLEPYIEDLQAMSPGQRNLIRYVQHHAELSSYLERGDRQPASLARVHGDARPSNCLVLAKGATAEVPRTLYLVDWEFCGLGAPEFDVATFIAQTVALWVASLPVAGGDLDGPTVALAALPLARAQSAITSFLSGYEQHLDGEQRSEVSPARLQRALVMCILHAAWERSVDSQTLTPTTALLGHLAANFAVEPDLALAEILAGYRFAWWPSC
ncbi:MAG: phosphotransferase family protein [Solirubrobacteraceae bacterium]